MLLPKLDVLNCCAIEPARGADKRAEFNAADFGRERTKLRNVVERLPGTEEAQTKAVMMAA